MYSVIYSIIALVVVCQFRQTTRMGVLKILNALEQGAKSVLPIMSSCAGAGVVVGVVFITGLGARFSTFLVDFAAGNLYLSLLMAMIVSIILGMGLPTTAAYVIQVALVVPALKKIGLPVHVAHLFVLYFSALSLITPPVAITSYAAAGIAGSKIMRTSLEACKLTAAVYLIPFIFVFNPSLLLIGNVSTVILTILTALVGIAIFAAGVEGYLLGKMFLWERTISVFSGILLLKPGIHTDAIGFLLVSIVLSVQFWKRRKDILNF
jgi:TRAP transporter 4TM/12TM fusion protein